MTRKKPYERRVTLTVTLTQYLRGAESVQADYKYSFDQEGDRSFGSLRLSLPVSDHVYGPPSRDEEKIRAMFDQMCRRAVTAAWGTSDGKDADLWLLESRPGESTA